MSTDTREALPEHIERVLLDYADACFRCGKYSGSNLDRIYLLSAHRERMWASVKEAIRAALATKPAQPSARPPQCVECGGNVMWRCPSCGIASSEAASIAMRQPSAQGEAVATAAAPAQAVPSSCDLTECKNMPKCDRCKAWDSMGI